MNNGQGDQAAKSQDHASRLSIVDAIKFAKNLKL